MMTTLVNGQFQDSLAVSDRGLQYGDGIWETILISSSGYPILLEEHLKRLQWGCKVIDLQGLDENLLRQEIAQVIQNTSHLILKIIITRGSGGRGYSSLGLSSPTRLLSLHDIPKNIQYHRDNGICIQHCDTRLSRNAKLSGFKHLNRLEQVLVRNELSDKHQEGIVCDTQGNVIEGTMSNLFLIVDNNTVITPLLDKSGIKGIMRAYIISLLDKKNIDLIERSVAISDVNSAQALFFSNSVIGLWPVRKLESKSFPLEEKSFSADVISYLQDHINKLETHSSPTSD
ncbi:MAG TPA: aminodeoxychorismate lyase [Leucothrix mucor]|nr:aminodeoxychorismate lyase [Leucothrix mucor]